MNAVQSQPTERPILFKPEMVKAILMAHKTVTRRILKPQLPIGVKWWEVYNGELNYRIVDHKLVFTHCKCPFGKVGDFLWVRERFTTLPPIPGKACFMYAADYHHYHNAKGLWKPSIHMPKIACRLKLEITNIKIERLNDISEESAISEGVQYDYTVEDGRSYVNYSIKHPSGFSICNLETAKESYRTLWESINGNGSWDLNPFVWVIEFDATVLI